MNDLQILLATILGALLVLLAAWMIAVRRDPARNTAKFFGIELDLSTPGLGVLVVGCGLLLASAFLPHRPGGLPSFLPSRGEGAKGIGDDHSSILRQQTVVKSEQEPNDSVGSANLIALGQTISGTLAAAEDAADYFALASMSETRGSKRVVLRTRGPASGCCASLTVWNQKEEEIAGGSSIIGSTISVLAPPAEAYLIRVSTNTIGYKIMNYELIIMQDR
jgi:hypothetical protein